MILLWYLFTLAQGQGLCVLDTNTREDAYYYLAAYNAECEGEQQQVDDAWTLRTCARTCMRAYPEWYPEGSFIWGGHGNGPDKQNGERMGKCWCQPQRHPHHDGGNDGLTITDYPHEQDLWWNNEIVPLCTFKRDWKYSAYNYMKCPAGRYAPKHLLDPTCGVYEAYNCLKCPAGQYNEEACGSADCPSLFECQLCPAGRYQDQIGGAECKKCPKGTYSLPIPGVQVDSFCFSCPAGFYMDTEGYVFEGTLDSPIRCKKCSAGKYQDQVRSDSCKGCLAGYYSGEEGLSQYAQCIKCPKGFYSEQIGQIDISTCQECPAGTWSNQLGLYSVDLCSLCPPGKWSDEKGLESETCKLCPEGKWSDEQGLQSELCKDCPLGKFSANEGLSSNCVQCPEGYFENELRSLACKACGEGQFQDEREKTLCKPCERGRFSKLAQPLCTVCPPNSYAPEEGSSECEGDLLWGSPIPEYQIIPQIVFRTYDGAFRISVSIGEVSAGNNPDLYLPQGEYLLSRIDDMSVCSGSIGIGAERIGDQSVFMYLETGVYTYRCETRRSLEGNIQIT